MNEGGEKTPKKKGTQIKKKFVYFENRVPEQENVAFSTVKKNGGKLINLRPCLVTSKKKNKKICKKKMTVLHYLPCAQYLTKRKVGRLLMFSHLPTYLQKRGRKKEEERKQMLSAKIEM